MNMAEQVNLYNAVAQLAGSLAMVIN